jgi:hypothetical protein
MSYTYTSGVASLTTRNFMMAEIIKRFLVPGIVFDKQDHMARRWAPRHDRFPEIVIDPRVAYGQPVGPSGFRRRRLWIPTSPRARTWTKSRFGLVFLSRKPHAP